MRSPSSLAGSRSASAPARAGAGGTGKRAVRSDAFRALASAIRSPTAPKVSDLVNGPSKSTKTRAGSVPVRNLRRGEFEGVASKYARGSFDEFKDICRRLTDKDLDPEEQLTHSGVKDLCGKDKIGTKYGTIRNYIYGVKKPDGTYLIAPGAWETMTAWKTTADKHASQRLINEEEEEFLLHVVVRAARSKHGLSEQLLKSCARKIVSRSRSSSTACAPAHARERARCPMTGLAGHSFARVLSFAFTSQIATRTGVAYTHSLDKWFEAFVARAERVHGIKLKEAATRQQSAGRAALSQKTIEDFTDLVRDLLTEDQCSMLTLNSIGNADEWWFDINKLMQRSTASATRARRTTTTSPRSPTSSKSASGPSRGSSRRGATTFAGSRAREGAGRDSQALRGRRGVRARDDGVHRVGGAQDAVPLPHLARARGRGAHGFLCSRSCSPCRS